MLYFFQLGGETSPCRNRCHQWIIQLPDIYFGGQLVVSSPQRKQEQLILGTIRKPCSKPEIHLKTPWFWGLLGSASRLEAWQSGLKNGAVSPLGALGGVGKYRDDKVSWRLTLKIHLISGGNPSWWITIMYCTIGSCRQAVFPVVNHLGGGFKYFSFSPLPGEMIQFD